MIKSNFTEEDETKELIESFETDYLKIGMEIMTSVNRILVLLTILGAVVFLDSKHPFYWRAITIWPLVFILFWLIDKYCSKNKQLTKILFISIIIICGVSMIYASLKNQKYVFYEIWAWYILLCQYFGILMFANYVKVVLSFYFVIFAFIVSVNLLYDEIPFVLYISLMNIIIYFPLICIFISQKFKEMIMLLKTKKDLVHTIQTILKVLPEGVIIRSFDPIAKRVIIEYANDYAQKFLNEDNEGVSITDQLILNIAKPSASPPSNRSDNPWSLSNFLNLQERKIEESKDWVSEMVEI